MVIWIFQEIGENADMTILTDDKEHDVVNMFTWKHERLPCVTQIFYFWNPCELVKMCHLSSIQMMWHPYDDMVGTICKRWHGNCTFQGGPIGIGHMAWPYRRRTGGPMRDRHMVVSHLLGLAKVEQNIVACPKDWTHVSRMITQQFTIIPTTCHLTIHEIQYV